MVELPIITQDGERITALVNMEKVRYIVAVDNLKCLATTEDEQFYINLPYDMVKKKVCDKSSDASQVTRM